MIKVNDVKIGKVSQPANLEVFIKNISGNKDVWDFKQRKYVKGENNEFKYTDISGDVYQQNYMSYLENCWADHLIAVINPDIIWYTILCELTSVVSGNVEGYRYLFTDSKDKKEISVETGDPIVIPLDSVIEKLKDVVPTDIDIFLPSFSTSNARSTLAKYAAFCDMVSPYYDYSMYCCGIPFVRVDGTKEDYGQLLDSWLKIYGILRKVNGADFEVFKWATRITTLLSNISTNLTNSSFWQKMFYLERCGSGSDTEVRGWWKDFYRETPSVGYVENYSTHISNVSYKYLPTQQNYIMKSGLLFSKLEGEGILVPEFGRVVYEKLS